MDWMSIMWILCAVVWGILIVGCIVLRIVNKFRNRAYKDDDPGSDRSDDNTGSGGFYAG